MMSDQTAPQARSSKIMSSRLMTMKFMQRAAASAPSILQLQTRTSENPPSKRQKVSAAPSWTATSSSDLQLIQIALAEEEEKRGKVIERLAEEAGETNWVLSTVNGDEGDSTGGFRVAKAGYSDIDQEAWTPIMIGRRSFGKFNRDLEKRQDGTADGSPSSSEIDSKTSEEEEEKGETAGTGSSYHASKEKVDTRTSDERHQRKHLRIFEKAELARLAEKRRSKEVRLNRLSSVSGGGGNGGKPGGSGNLDMECYSCREKGHAKRDCPQKGKRRNEDWRGGAAKRSKPSLDS